MMPTASSQIFEKIFNRFLREAHRYKQDCSSSKKSLENLKENLRKSFYDRFYNFERHEKNELSHDASASQIFDRFSKDFLRFLREAHPSFSPIL